MYAGLRLTADQNLITPSLPLHLADIIPAVDGVHSFSEPSGNFPTTMSIFFKLNTRMFIMFLSSIFKLLSYRHVHEEHSSYVEQHWQLRVFVTVFCQLFHLIGTKSKHLIDHYFTWMATGAQLIGRSAASPSAATSATSFDNTTNSPLPYANSPRSGTNMMNTPSPQ
ncbi:hypothetical protein CRYUN_Cryun37aG0014300 [Craigia yunnanensis]